MYTKGRKFLSDLSLYSNMLGWNEKENRPETWEEAVEEVFDTHRKKYHKYLDKLEPYIQQAEESNKQKYFLGSQRMLQFRGDDIFKHEYKMYNCLGTILDKPSFFGNALYLLLCGCGLDCNMMLPFVERLPKIIKRDKGIKEFVIEDNIEGWSHAMHALITSYLYKDAVPGYEEYNGYKIVYDFSKIRLKGAKLGRRFKAPGHEAFKKAIEHIETLLDAYVTDTPKEFISILAYDIFMFEADCVLAGGVRRAACSIICSPEDKQLVFAKTGNWVQENPQRGRSNNTVGLIKGEFSKKEFQYFLDLNKGVSDIGFIFLNHIFEASNPCREIRFVPLYFNFDDQSIVKRIMKSDLSLLDNNEVTTCFNNCNLVEINGGKMKNRAIFLETCRNAAITATLQAGYTNLAHLSSDVLEYSIALCEREALIGVGITGFMNNPKILLNPDILQEGAKVVVETNEEIVEIIEINASARDTTVKPAGTTSVILGTASGIGCEHSKKNFRVMQLNKETDTAIWLKENMPFLLEESEQSSSNLDYVVFIPIENEDGTIYKDELKGVKHLEVIKLVQENWVNPGQIPSRCTVPTTNNSVSNTIIIDDEQAIANYIFENQDSLTAVSFIGSFGDKDYNQCPFTSVLTFEEIHEKYGDGALFASGLIVDGLHAFDDNLWNGCEAVKNKAYMLTGDRYKVFEKKEWIRRAKKFAKNYFKGDLEMMLYCVKDVHLLHKWKTITREMKEVDFTKILTKPTYIDADTLGAASCSGTGSCEITRI